MIKVKIMASCPMIAIFVENDNQSFTNDSTAAAVDSKAQGELMIFSDGGVPP